MEITHGQQAQLEPLIRSVLKKYSFHTEYDELLHVGMCGVLIAMSKIDELPCAFSTYVCNQGRWAIQNYLRNECSLVPYNRYAASKGEEQIKVQSLDAISLIPGFEPSGPNPYIEVENRVAAQQIWAILKEKCTSRQLSVIKRTILEGRTYREVAEEEGVGESRIYQIINAGLAKYHRRYKEVEVHGSCRRASSHRNRRRRGGSVPSNRPNGTPTRKVGEKAQGFVGERPETGLGRKAA